MPRQAKVERKTNETAIELALTLDGTGDAPDRHAGAVLQPHAGGGGADTACSTWRSTPPATSRSTPTTPSRTSGICLGQAFREALGDRAASPATATATIPMDETLVSAAVDFGGRAAFVYRADALKGRWVGTFDVELAREFFGGFVSAALCNLHLEVRYGENAHHMIEALFKAFARATARGGAPRPARGRACRRPRGR